MATRLAILSDVHGNLPALDAVLADLEARGGADRYIMLGDFAALGAWPAESIARLRALPDIRFIRGNTDRYVLDAGERVGNLSTDEQAQRDRLFGWSKARLNEGDLAFLRQLPFDQPLEFVGRIVLAVHGSPRSDEEGVRADTPDAQVADMLASVEADVVLLGHTHVQFDRVEPTTGYRVVNPGSIGAPFDGDTRAAYAVLHVDEDNNELDVELRRVPYDLEAAIRGLHEHQFPAADLIERRLRSAAM